MPKKGLSFRKFLEAGVTRKIFGDTPENDFAKDTMRDSRFRDFNDWESLRSYIVFHGACPEAVDAAQALFKKWQAGQ